MADRPPIAELIAALADRIGVPVFVEVCVDLLGGADRSEHAEALRHLTGSGAGVMDRESWKDYWVRTWGARGLLHVWDDAATDAVVAGLRDDHYRPAEMCLKVATRHEVAGAGDGAAHIAVHELPLVRVQALRCLAVCGDREHVDVVREALDDEHADVRRQAERALSALDERLDLSP